MASPTERFTETVENYIKYRPSYPAEVIQVLIKECGMTEKSIIADIGSGTGILSKLLLEQRSTVYGIEPNQAMRNAAEKYLKEYPNFISINGAAEATRLKDCSVNIITAATAFHWFNAEKSRVEFKRILKTSGWLMLVWNVRDTESKIMRDYENLILRYGKDYRNSKAKEFDTTATENFFKPYKMKTASFKNMQQFDWEGLKGRQLSASHSLREGDTEYDDMLKELKIIFERYQKNGKVEFLYNTKLYYGQL